MLGKRERGDLTVRELSSGFNPELEFEGKAGERQ